MEEPWAYTDRVLTLLGSNRQQLRVTARSLAYSQAAPDRVLFVWGGELDLDLLLDAPSIQLFVFEDPERFLHAGDLHHLKRDLARNNPDKSFIFCEHISNWKLEPPLMVLGLNRR